MENIVTLSKKYGINVKTLGNIRGYVSRRYGEYNEEQDCYEVLDDWFLLLKENPYILVDLPNYGFKRTDIIAKKIGFDMKDPKRIIASVEYSVEQTSKGGTIVEFNSVVEKIISLLGINDIKFILSTIKEHNTNKFLLLDKNLKVDKDNPTLMTIDKWSKVEKGIWYMLKNSEKILKNNQNKVKEIVEDIKESLPFTLNERQNMALSNIPNENINILTGLGGCLPSGTEILTPNGWVEIQNWDGQHILEIEIKDKKNICGSFKKPLKFHTYVKDQFYKINGKLIVSKFHNNLLEKNGCFFKKTTKELLGMDKIDCYIPKSFNGLSSSVKKMRLKGRPQDLIEKVECGDFMYCFTTSSGNFLIRQNGEIFCTGNSGKSFTTNTILKTLDRLNETYTLLAPTGTASKVLSGMTGRETQTIHRMYYSQAKIFTNWLIVDESSMLSLEHFRLILNMIDNRSVKLLFIGDINQLTPISPGSPFRDMINLIESGIIKGNVIHLTQIMRSSDELAIAHICKMFTEYGSYDSSVLEKKHKGVEFIPLNKDNLKDQILDTLRSRNFKLEDTYILSSMNVREQGTNAINKFVQQTNLEDVLYSDKFKVYKKNDILMHTKNNGALGIFNGERVRLLRTKKSKKDNSLTYICKKLDDNSTVVYSKVCLMNETMLSYSCSCHKSQGQTIDNVIVILPSSHSFMLNRNMVYTALSRASKNLIIFYEGNILTTSSKKVEINKRKTFLREIYLRKK